MALVAHLGADFGILLGKAAQFTRLPDRARERFLDVDVDAHRDGHVGRQEVHVVGRADDERVDLVAHLEQHLPEILIAFGARKRREGLLHLLQAPIDVAQRDDFLVGKRLNVGESLVVETHAGDPDLGSGLYCARRANLRR